MRKLSKRSGTPQVAAGYRQDTLTNSPALDVAREQPHFAGLTDLFDDCLSADEVKALKPAPAPYHHVATRTGVDIAHVRLVAAHAWDVSGALAAGAKAAFVARPGAVPSPLGRQPDIIAKDIAGVSPSAPRVSRSVLRTARLRLSSFSVEDGEGGMRPPALLMSRLPELYSR